MKTRYLVIPHQNLDLIFFSANMEKHNEYLRSYEQVDLNELFSYCQDNYVTVFAMSRERGHIEELKYVDNLIGKYQIRMSSTQLSFLGSVLSLR